MERTCCRVPRIFQPARDRNLFPSFIQRPGVAGDPDYHRLLQPEDGVRADPDQCGTLYVEIELLATARRRWAVSSVRLTGGVFLTMVSPRPAERTRPASAPRGSGGLLGTTQRPGSTSESQR